MSARLALGAALAALLATGCATVGDSRLAELSAAEGLHGPGVTPLSATHARRAEPAAGVVAYGSPIPAEVVGRGRDGTPLYLPPPPPPIDEASTRPLVLPPPLESLPVRIAMDSDLMPLQPVPTTPFADAPYAPLPPVYPTTSASRPVPVAAPTPTVMPPPDPIRRLSGPELEGLVRNVVLERPAASAPSRVVRRRRASPIVRPRVIEDDCPT
jgi:hypothetical protein